jgi:hypothetical protein
MSVRVDEVVRGEGTDLVVAAAGRRVERGRVGQGHAGGGCGGDEAFTLVG